MDYLEFLERVHRTLEPPTYLEIGIRFGASLALSRAASVGIDPAYELRNEPPPGAALFRETSDDYFERADPLEPLGGITPALAFIDGMHLIEYALRDFVNVERHADWSSVVVFDDILPRDYDEAARERTTKAWAGDVFKIVGILARYRPDLVCLQIDTEPTGVMLVLGLNPEDRTLADNLDAILEEAVTADPQDLPAELVHRTEALDPERVLAGSFWGVLRDAREAGTPRKKGIGKLRRAVRRDLGKQLTGVRLRDVLPGRA
jgi:hypothetical protein